MTQWICIYVCVFITVTVVLLPLAIQIFEINLRPRVLHNALSCFYFLNALW